MRVSVCARVVYRYEAEIPDGVDIESTADSADPVYPRFVKALVNEGLNYEGRLSPSLTLRPTKFIMPSKRSLYNCAFAPGRSNT